MTDSKPKLSRGQLRRAEALKTSRSILADTVGLFAGSTLNKDTDDIITLADYILGKPEPVAHVRVVVEPYIPPLRWAAAVDPDAPIGYFLTGPLGPIPVPEQRPTRRNAPCYVLPYVPTIRFV